MAEGRPLYEYIGEPVVIMAPSTLSSAGVAASDNANGFTVGEFQGVMLLEINSGGDSDWAATLQFQYSSTGNASDAATSNAGMTCTDMVGSSNNDTTASADWKIVDVNLAAKSWDAAGKIFVSVAAAETGSKYVGVVAIPYGGTRQIPSTMAQAALAEA